MRRVVPFIFFAFTALPAAAQMLDVSGVGSAARESAGFGPATAIASDSGESPWEMLSRLLFGEEQAERAAASDVICREHVRQVRLGNELVDASGVFCRGTDGSWTLKK